MSNQAPNSDEVPPTTSEVEETAKPQEPVGEEIAENREYFCF